MNYQDYTAPRIAVVKTLGGYYRVYVHGPDNLQSQTDRPRYCEMDIGRGHTKEEALKAAEAWFSFIEDRATAQPEQNDD